VDKKLKEFFIRPPPYTNESQVIRYPPCSCSPTVADLFLCIAAPQLPLWGKITDRFMMELNYFINNLIILL
jgi:hypothetical protein